MKQANVSQDELVAERNQLRRRLEELERRLAK